jgi:RNA polymerase sigma factor for flagellar operon FliA
MSKSLQELVNAYCDAPAPGLRNAIITEAMPLVKSIIGKIKRPDNPLTQYEDIESAAIMGLLQSLDSYRKEKKIQFNTYAYYRIKGSVIDYLRKVDEMPRLQRVNFGKAQKVMEKLMQKLGRAPEDDEVAEELDMSLEEYHKLLINVQQRAALSLNDQKFDDNDSHTLSSYIADPNAELPDAEIIRKSISDKIQEKLKDLKERDRLILALYYYEDLTLNEIAILLGLTEARISQIIGKLLIQLKSSLNI